MRFRTKINIDYANIIKDDIKVEYKKKGKYIRMKKNGNYKKIPGSIKEILKNNNFRNNQNYMLNQKTINNYNNLNTLKIFFKSFGLIFFALSFYLTVIFNGFFMVLFFVILIFIYNKFFKEKKDIFKIKEKYFNRHFIYIVDKIKNDKNKI